MTARRETVRQRTSRVATLFMLVSLVILVWPLILVSLVLPLRAEGPPIGIIDFYGLGPLPERQVREALKIAEGDPVPENPAVTDAERRLAALPGVAAVRLNRVCCEDGKAILYVGVQQKGARITRFHQAPAGSIQLPDEVRKAGAAFEQAFERAIERGDVEDDHSQGHSLMHDPACRAIQQQFVSFANRDRLRLREVLRDSADAQQRALAAQVLAYVTDKRDVMSDLTGAMGDPDEDVRNNATRALWVIADFGRLNPSAGIHVPFEPFVDLLNSLIWSDRNKSSLALMEISADRDPALLGILRTKAVLSLVEMARWKSRGHATAAVVLLGRVGGVPEADLQAAVASGDHAAAIDAALKRLRLQ
jgi:hypothetical protein